MRQPLISPLSFLFGTITSCAAHWPLLGSIRPAATSSCTHFVAASVSAGDTRLSRCFTGTTSSPISTMLNFVAAAVCSAVLTGSSSTNTLRWRCSTSRSLALSAAISSKSFTGSIPARRWLARCRPNSIVCCAKDSRADSGSMPESLWRYTADSLATCGLVATVRCTSAVCTMICPTTGRAAAAGLLVCCATGVLGCTVGLRGLVGCRATGCPFSRSHVTPGVMVRPVARCQLRPTITSLLSSSITSAVQAATLPCTAICFSCTSCVDCTVRSSASVIVTGCVSGDMASRVVCSQLRRTKQHDAPVSTSMSSHHTPSSCPRATIVLARAALSVLGTLDAMPRCSVRGASSPISGGSSCTSSAYAFVSGICVGCSRTLVLLLRSSARRCAVPWVCGWRG